METTSEKEKNCTVVFAETRDEHPRCFVIVVHTKYNDISKNLVQGHYTHKWNEEMLKTSAKNPCGLFIRTDCSHSKEKRLASLYESL